MTGTDPLYLACAIDFLLLEVLSATGSVCTFEDSPGPTHHREMKSSNSQHLVEFGMQVVAPTSQGGIYLCQYLFPAHYVAFNEFVFLPRFLSLSYFGHFLTGFIPEHFLTKSCTQVLSSGSVSRKPKPKNTTVLQALGLFCDGKLCIDRHLETTHANSTI